ncbi:UDP-4-amino-4,6-dideoxy-N-acetyl-beta-L-altrosamine transaminase [Alphaproteobacteria bacterium]|nr:UDP-4-amino-4,6-dideoxy-N-acetyl-beta-L-altrosamine transaminase [Alphaproteobacteria bacterium]
MNYIPYAKHELSNNDFLLVKEALDSDMLTNGKFVGLFEGELSKITNSKYVCACSNGTTALHLAVWALGIAPGDFVVIPSLTFSATANTVIHVGGDIIFADVDVETGLMTAATIEEAILNFAKTNDVQKIKAIVNVHYAGQCENLKDIWELAQKYNLKIIEDAAHAIGSFYLDGKNEYAVGSNAFSDITTFSFHPTKTITTGEGGAVTTNNSEYAKKIKLLGSHAMERTDFENPELSYPGYYEIQQLGHNFRISDINCALGIGQLKKLDKFIEKRRSIVKLYDSLFAESRTITPLKNSIHSKAARHLYVVFMDFSGIGRNNFMNKMKEEGVGTQVYYCPIHMHPFYYHKYGKISLKNTEAFFSRCLSIPLFTQLTEKEVMFVTRALMA